MLARDIIRIAARIGPACAVWSILAWGQPALTTISDVRLKADGNRFNGLAQITWLSFDSASGASIAQQSTTVRIIDGNLFVQLTPTSNATPLAQYLVLYESDGRILFQETWNVTPSITPLRVRDVRTSQPLFPISGGGGAGGLTSIQESDVTGLVADLTARAVKGPGYSNSRTAIITDVGQIEGAAGATTDCIHVDGTSGACGAGSSPAFSAVTPGTNTGALLVGTGGSLAPTGSGTITPSVGTGLAILGNTAVTDSSIIPQKNATNVFTAPNSFTGGISTGSSPPSMTFGTGGGFASAEGTAPSAGLPAANVDGCYADSTAHGYKCSFNSDTASLLARASSNLGFFGSTTSAQLAGVISDKTGSGALVFATSPTLTTPTIGVATATSVNKMTITPPATSSTLTVADGKTLAASNTLTLTGADSSSVSFGGGGTVTYTIANGTSALGAIAITANSCATLVTTLAIGTTSTDTISWSPNADISGVTGYGILPTDGLKVYPYPTTNSVNWRVCNGTGSSITPGSVTLNWRVVR
jgi:hypothetical protein